MNKYTYYERCEQLIGMRLTKGTFNEVLKLISGHGMVEKYAANSEDCTIDFTQRWPRSADVQTIRRGEYITSENSGLHVYAPWEFRGRFEQVYHMDSWYTPTPDEVAVIECLDFSAEYCWAYDHICGETKLDRATATKIVAKLRDMGVVAFYRGLMNDDGEVCGSGFCIRDRYRAEALLYRYYGGKNENRL